MLKHHWYELQKHYDNDNGGRMITERFIFEERETESMMDARAQLIARMAVARAVTPEVKFMTFVCTREQLDWSE